MRERVGERFFCVSFRVVSGKSEYRKVPKRKLMLNLCSFRFKFEFSFILCGLLLPVLLKIILKSI